jgi:hypothetical protein
MWMVVMEQGGTADVIIDAIGGTINNMTKSW